MKTSSGIQEADRKASTAGAQGWKDTSALSMAQQMPQYSCYHCISTAFQYQGDTGRYWVWEGAEGRKFQGLRSFPSRWYLDCNHHLHNWTREPATQFPDVELLSRPSPVLCIFLANYVPFSSCLWIVLFFSWIGGKSWL